MAQQHLKFAIFGNEYQAKKSASIEKILLYLEKKEAEVYVENAYYEFLTRDQHLDVKAAGVFEDYNFDVDYVISMGGDGTFLKAASRVGAKGTPIIGVNMGRLGFLADVLPSEIDKAFLSAASVAKSRAEKLSSRMRSFGEPVSALAMQSR